MNEYTSLSDVRTYMSLGSADTSDDAVILQFIRKASRAIEKYTRRKFYPSALTLVYDYPPNSRILQFERDDVLEIKGLSDMGGASAISSTAYNLKCGATYNMTPYDRVEITDNSGSIFNYSATTQKAVHAQVVTGYHEDYHNAWTNSGASLTADIASQVTIASVSGSGGETVWGISPRFKTQQIWRVDKGTPSEEYMYVMDTNPTGTGSSYIRLVRGVNGTTAASHASGVSIEVFEIESDIEFCTKRLAAIEYERARSPFTNTVIAPQMGVIEMPTAWPIDISEKLNRYKKMKLYAAGLKNV